MVVASGFRLPDRRQLSQRASHRPPAGRLVQWQEMVGGAGLSSRQTCAGWHGHAFDAFVAANPSLLAAPGAAAIEVGRCAVARRRPLSERMEGVRMYNMDAELVPSDGVRLRVAGRYLSGWRECVYICSTTPIRFPSPASGPALACAVLNTARVSSPQIRGGAGLTTLPRSRITNRRRDEAERTTTRGTDGRLRLSSQGAQARLRPGCGGVVDALRDAAKRGRGDEHGLQEALGPPQRALDRQHRAAGGRRAVDRVRLPQGTGVPGHISSGTALKHDDR